MSLMLKIYVIFLLCVWRIERVMCMGVQCPWNQERDEGSPRAEIKGGCKLPEWVLGTKFESSAKAVCTPNP